MRRDAVLARGPRPDHELDPEALMHWRLPATTYQLVQWVGCAMDGCACCAARVPRTSAGGRSAANAARRRTWRSGPTDATGCPASPCSLLMPTRIAILIPDAWFLIPDLLT